MVYWNLKIYFLDGKSHSLKITDFGKIKETIDKAFNSGLEFKTGSEGQNNRPTVRYPYWMIEKAEYRTREEE